MRFTFFLRRIENSFQSGLTLRQESGVPFRSRLSLQNLSTQEKQKHTQQQNSNGNDNDVD
jgi:hypothetical protein